MTLYKGMPCPVGTSVKEIRAMAWVHQWLSLGYVTQSILSRPSASGCFPLGIGLGAGNGFALGRNSMAMSMTTMKAESAAMYKSNECTRRTNEHYAPTDFRILSHLILSISVRRSPSSTMALFMSSYVPMFSIRHCTRS